MSGSEIFQAPVPTKALWTWSTPVVGQQPMVQSYPTVSGVATKTGLTPTDLQNFVVVPLQSYTNPPVPIASGVVQQWIRWAEDKVEQETGIRLCQTWIAAPAAKSQISAQAINITTSGSYQQLGVDYDVPEAAYDFFFFFFQEHRTMAGCISTCAGSRSSRSRPGTRRASSTRRT